MKVLHEQDDRVLRREAPDQLDPGVVQAVARDDRVQLAGDVEPKREREDLPLAEKRPERGPGGSVSTMPNCSWRISASGRYVRPWP